MARRRRGAERAQKQAAAAARSIRHARCVAGMTRESASARAGIARSTWERIEGGATNVTFANLVAAADAVGLDLVCQMYPGHEPGLRDSGQLAMAAMLSDMAGPGWRITLEEPAGDHGEAIDQVFWGASEILAVEIERFLLDWQAQSRRWALKRDWLAARHARPVRLVVVVTDTRRNRAAVGPFLPVIERALPAGSRAVLQAIRTGEPLGTDGLCWMRPPPRPPRR
ncbi:MAG TPA: helix-turn-helix transcriptional regulator [Candidatus Limnocylindrales bacterium]|nr:helix-turn-helix transcriptional regulator [Candidatus Limnocylindrales bacterium]